MKHFQFINKSARERGIALIVVISMLAVMMVVALGLMSEATVSNLSGVTIASRGALKYEAESALSRALWCYMWDRRKFTADHRNLGSELQERESEDGAPWLANGMPRMLVGDDEGKSVIVKIHDAVSGKDISTKHRPGSDIRKEDFVRDMEDLERLERIERFTYAMDDYVDENEYHSHQDYKYEMIDYEEMGIVDFPANNKFQVREEVYWLDEVGVFAESDEGKIYNNYFRVIPPRIWKNGPSRTTASMMRSGTPKTSLLSTGVNQIVTEEGLNEAEHEELKEFKAGKLLWEDLSPELQGILNSYSRNESGVATFIVTGLKYNGEINRTIKATYDCNSILKGKNFFHCWEQIIY